jgi:hypothetical protein
VDVTSTPGQFHLIFTARPRYFSKKPYHFSLSTRPEADLVLLSSSALIQTHFSYPVFAKPLAKEVDQGRGQIET